MVQDVLEASVDQEDSAKLIKDILEGARVKRGKVLIPNLDLPNVCCYVCPAARRCNWECSLRCVRGQGCRTECGLRWGRRSRRKG